MALTNYIIRRLALIVPTLLGIIFINFLIVQIAPGGPVEVLMQRLQSPDAMGSATARVSGAATEVATGSYRGAQGLDDEIRAELNAQFGFDRPWYERLGKMIYNYARFDFGTSYFQDKPVIELIKDKLPVSLSLGIWSTLIIYLISIPLGITKAVRHGSRFDVATTFAIVIAYAVPGFLFAILLITFFAGGTYFDWFPLRGLSSIGAEDWPWWERVLDYLWHLVLPVLAFSIGGFAALTMLCKNSFLEEVNKQYVLAAYARGASRNRVLYGHVFRNALLIVISGFPAVLIGMLFAGSVLIEVIFTLDGLGLLGFEAIVNRDYAVVFATLYIFTLIGLVVNLLNDLMYVAIDPRIDFSNRS